MVSGAGGECLEARLGQTKDGQSSGEGMTKGAGQRQLVRNIKRWLRCRRSPRLLTGKENRKRMNWKSDDG